MQSTNENELYEFDEIQPLGQFVTANAGSSVAVPFGRTTLPPRSPTSQELTLRKMGLRITTVSYSLSDSLIFTERSSLLERSGVDLDIVRGFQLISKELEGQGIEFFAKGEVIHDAEKVESEVINVVFYISGVPYADLLRLWGALSPKFALALDPVLRGRVHLVIRRKR